MPSWVGREIGDEDAAQDLLLALVGVDWVALEPGQLLARLPDVTAPRGGQVQEGAVRLPGQAQEPRPVVRSLGSTLNALTVPFAAELRDTPIKPNTADPGYSTTDRNAHGDHRTVKQGAKAAGATSPACRLAHLHELQIVESGRRTTRGPTGTPPRRREGDAPGHACQQ
jgi:hypothetical protein